MLLNLSLLVKHPLYVNRRVGAVQHQRQRPLRRRGPRRRLWRLRLLRRAVDVHRQPGGGGALPASFCARIPRPLALQPRLLLQRRCLSGPRCSWRRPPSPLASPLPHWHLPSPPPPPPAGLPTRCVSTNRPSTVPRCRPPASRRTGLRPARLRCDCFRSLHRKAPFFKAICRSFMPATPRAHSAGALNFLILVAAAAFPCAGCVQQRGRGLRHRRVGGQSLVRTRVKSMEKWLSLAPEPPN